MNTRTRTIASFFTVAMAAMLLGAVVTTQLRRPEAALARAPEVATASPDAATPRSHLPITLDTFRDVARQNTPGVVNINTRKVVKRPRMRDLFGDEMFERFFGPQGSGPDRQTQTSLGSGFVIDKEGHVLTNRHVVEGADEISVTLANGKQYDAKLVGRDGRTDVALLKIEARDPLTVLELGDSDQVEVGEWVMAVGNPFGLGGNSVTVGVVSYKGRPLALNAAVVGTAVEMIQTDAAINPGNSGGPLLNARGQVVGINTLIITGGERQSAGVGFSVPINTAKEILPQLREKGKVVRGWLGVQIGDVNEDLAKSFKMKDARGAVVSDVTAGSPAEKAGLKPEDVVTSVDGKPIQDRGDLSRYIASKAPGTTVKLLLLRGGAEKALAVTLGTFPDENAEPESQPERKGQLGMSLRDLLPRQAEELELPRGTRGALIVDVEAGSAAERAGLRPKDVIVSVNGNPVTSVDGFESEIGKAKSDGQARLRVRRDNVNAIVILKLP